MSVVKGVSNAGMDLDAVKLDQRRQAPVKTDVESPDRAIFLVVRAVNDAAVRGYRQARPMFEVFACGQVDAGAAGRTDAVRTDAENNGGPIQRFRHRDERDQRMDLSDLRIVFETYMKLRMDPIDQRRAHGCPIDLPVKQPNASGKFLWVIGRPPDGLAFARSDRSGRDE